MSAIKTYVTPRSLEEAAELLRAGNATILAGGTDLMPRARAGHAGFQPVLMNIRRIAELRGVSRTESGLRIGALTTITELRDSDQVRSHFNALWQACDRFASDQVRNAGTIGGNVCNASPAGDTLVPLLVLDARVVLASKPNGALATRIMPLAEFLVGPGRTRRAANELLAAIEVPWPPPDFDSRFFKFGTRPALDISTISIGLGAVMAGNRLRDVRIAFGAVAPTPIRAPQTEAVLEGRVLDAATIVAALDAAEAEIHPISDLRASDWYRRELIRNMLHRMLDHVGGR